MVICLELGADLHMAQLMPLPLTVSCFSKIRIGFTFLVPAHLGSPGLRAVKRVCVCVCVFVSDGLSQACYARNQSLPEFRRWREYRKMYSVPFQFPFHTAYTEASALSLPTSSSLSPAL